MDVRASNSHYKIMYTYKIKKNVINIDTKTTYVLKR